MRSFMLKRRLSTHTTTQDNLWLQAVPSGRRHARLIEKVLSVSSCYRLLMGPRALPRREARYEKSAIRRRKVSLTVYPRG